MIYDSFVGIDPGITGGIAEITSGKIYALKMPATNRDILDLLEDMSDGCCKPFAFLESVHTMPHDSKKAATTFMKHCGALEMALVAADIPFEKVTPVVWQRSFGLLRKSKSESDTAKKNRHKAKAQELFGGTGIKITHAVADALLICEWGRRKQIK